MTPTIRDAVPADINVIAEYNAAMAQETEGRTLAPDVINAGVAAVMADPTKGRYWVCEQDGKIIGQIMVTWEWSDWRNGMQWWIQSVYVHPEQRRQGVFAALYRHVESLARADRNVCGLRLYVENENERAQQTYLALGMVRPGYLVMEADFRK
ncbi:MAG: GNAT family N-acetyltransferase [Woeseia sp.]